MAEPETLLQLGIDAAREGNREEARNLFSLLTRQEPDNVQAWLWLAGVAEGPEQRRAALERVIELDPDNEMAIKGLQAMGVPLPKRGNERAPAAPPPTPAPAAPPPAPEAPAKPAAAMSAEEQFAAELDAAFDDYDALPRAAPPPRAEQPPEEAGKLPPMPPRTSPVPPRAASSSPRSSAPRAHDDEEEEPPRKGPSPLLWVLLGIIALVLIAFLVIQLFFPPGAPGPVPSTQVVEQPTAPGTAPTPASEATPTAAEATPQPTDATPAPTPGEQPTTAPPADQPTPVPAPVTPPEQAQPAPVPIGTVLQADGWNYTYPNQLYALALGPSVANFTAEKGAFLHVLVFVANNTGTAQPLPRDFFVLKDAQGRVYQARPEVSSAAVRPGVNADVGHETPIPANGLTTSVYLVFDVAPDATNLVLFAKNKPDQGFLVIGAVR